MTIDLLLQKASSALMLTALVMGGSASAQTNQNDLAVTVPEPIVEEAVPATVQDVLLSVCEANGYGQDCAQTLLGMLWNESSNISTAIGDGGAARGYFQIHYKLHKISTDCAEDLVCSADWTIMYLERNSYPKYVSYAVQCHNSCNVENGYAARAARNGARLWNQPLEVKQAAAIDLAQLETSTEIAMK